jgi:Putative zinc-finger
MTAAMQTVCALGISGRTLSDYRSGGLAEKEAARLQAHIAVCEVCQARLASYEQMAQALRQQLEPGGHAELWQLVRASITAEARPATSFRGEAVRLPLRRAQQRQRVWTSLGSLAAILALSVGFLAVFATHRGTQPTNTPKVYHSGNLTWKMLTVPKGFPNVDQVTDQQRTASFPLVAQSDGRVAYACQANKRYVSSPTVWATTDAGASWSVITPSHIPADTGGCGITVDSNNAKTLAVLFYPAWPSAEFTPPDQWTTYVSFDSGHRWSKPAGLQGGYIVYQLQSAPGKVFALLRTVAGQYVNDSIYVSSDQMQSWSQVDAALPETAPNPSGVHETGKSSAWWVNVATGALLDQTYAGNLWYTVNDGAHWIKVNYPAGTSSKAGYTPVIFAGPPTTGTNQTICGVFSSATDPETVDWTGCSVDYGAHWYKLPDLPKVGSFDGIAGDKALGGVMTYGGTAGESVVYELSLGDGTSAQWQRLGGIPDSEQGYAYQAAPSGNQIMFWIGPSTSTSSGAGQPTTDKQPYYYVAVYP